MRLYSVGDPAQAISGRECFQHMLVSKGSLTILYHLSPQKICFRTPMRGVNARRSISSFGRGPWLARLERAPFW